MFKFLSGYRTYMAAVAIVMTGLSQIGAGDWSGGLLHVVQSDPFIVILNGLGLGAIRAAVEKVLLSFNQIPKPAGEIPAFEDYLFVDMDNKPISQAEFNKQVQSMKVQPVASLK